MRVIAILLIGLLSACAYSPMTVNLEPDTIVSASDIGIGNTVYLTVIDERTESTIGHRGAAMMKGAKITLEEDLSAVVQLALTEMLQTKGFEIGYDDSNSLRPSLRVDIRGLEYSTSTGFWTGGVEVSAALKAIAIGEGETYENFYRYGNEDRVVVVPGADSNNERINTALNDVLRQLMSDRKLLEVLAQG